jgi:hypothetical protein
MTDDDRRSCGRLPYRDAVQCTLLCMQLTDFRRTPISGHIVDASREGVGMETCSPIEAGNIIRWDDKHRPGDRHIALVKWACKCEDCYRGGLRFI